MWFSYSAEGTEQNEENKNLNSFPSRLETRNHGIKSYSIPNEKNSVENVSKYLTFTVKKLNYSNMFF